MGRLCWCVWLIGALSLVCVSVYWNGLLLGQTATVEDSLDPVFPEAENGFEVMVPPHRGGNNRIFFRLRGMERIVDLRCKSFVVVLFQLYFISISAPFWVYLSSILVYFRLEPPLFMAPKRFGC